MTSHSRETGKPVFILYSLFILIIFVWFLEIAKPVLQISLSVLPETITQLLIHSYLIRVTGVVIISISLIFMLITLLHFRNSLRFGLDEKNRGKLITTGIFSISRNPFFTSLILWFTGIALIFPSPFFIGFALLADIGIHFFILKEEKFMLRFHGAKYLEYRRKVRRYF